MTSNARLIRRLCHYRSAVALICGVARTLRLSAAIATMQLLSSTMVSAEPITVTRGSLAYTLHDGAVLIDWAGDGFVVPSFPFGDDRFRSPPGLCDACQPGELFSPGGVEEFGSRQGGLDDGSFTLGDRTYRMLRGSATFVSPEVVIPRRGASEEVFSVDSPFRYHGFFEGESDGGERVRVNLIGRGTAHVIFSSDEPTHWFSSIYQFSDAAPVPEPTSVLLVGLGVAAGLLRARGSRAAGSSGPRRV
jgi:hypothetical protein